MYHQRTLPNKIEKNTKKCRRDNQPLYKATVAIYQEPGCLTRYLLHPPCSSFPPVEKELGTCTRQKSLCDPGRLGAGKEDAGKSPLSHLRGQEGSSYSRLA